MDLRIGAYYDVTCAGISLDDGRVYYIPIFDHLHSDAQFSFPDQHYHIDARFEIHLRIGHLFHISNGYTSAIIAPVNTALYHYRGLASQRLKCVRLNTGLAIPANPNEKQQANIERYNAWYDTFIGQECKGKRCPHFGTGMLEKDGLLVCPMHRLTADLQNRVIIPRIA